MKPFIRVIITVYFFLLAAAHATAQMQPLTPSSSVIAELPLTICSHKTSSLIFPYAIKSVDRGSRDILVQRASGTDNILQVKAAGPFVDASSLTVITSDGGFYGFEVSYAAQPVSLNIRFAVDSPAMNSNFKSSISTVQSLASLSEAIIQHDAINIISMPRTLFGKKVSKLGVHLLVKGLYVRKDVFYFQLALSNRSPIDYAVDQLEFFIKDSKQSRRTAVQEIPIAPIYQLGALGQIMSDSNYTLVAAVPAFTIPDKKRLHLQLTEKNGARQLSITIRNRQLMQAVRLADSE